MKTLLSVVALFLAMTAYSQTAGGTDTMQSQIRRGLLQGHDRNLLMIQSDRANEIRNGRVSYDGIFIEMAKTDNPLQLINPAAPAGYGASWDNVVAKPNTASEPEGSSHEGLNLFSINF